MCFPDVYEIGMSHLGMKIIDDQMNRRDDIYCEPVSYTHLLTTSCIALALMFGIGGASCFNLNMGRGSSERAVYFVGNAIVCLIGSGVILFGIAEIFLTPLL